MYFCIRDDDTSFFTSPDELGRAYGDVTQQGPVSLAVIPYCRAGTSKWVPERFRNRWSVHPLHENRPLVSYLRAEICAGRFEIMLHGYYHDEPRGYAEFLTGHDLALRVADGRKYLEDLLGTTVRVFVPPHNTIGRRGLHAIARQGLHLGCLAGVRSGWPPLSCATWRLWRTLRRWHKGGGVGIPWVLDLGDHHEIDGNPVTPISRFERNQLAFETAMTMQGVFCAATHYWELEAVSLHAGDPKVGEHLRYLIDRARSEPQVMWRSVGDVVSDNTLVI